MGPAAQSPGTGIDWAGLMRAGMQGLGLKPGEFWDLTPAELAVMLGITPAERPMSRTRLAELMAQFPDRPAPASRDT